MNDTTTTTSAGGLRYDSVDSAQGHDERHSIRTYLSDALALERHIAQPLKRQLDADDVAKFADAFQLISKIISTNATHITTLEAQLKTAGGDGASALKSAWSQLLGVGAVAVGSARSTKVSKNLRDDYTALSLASISYTMLHATALGLGDDATAELAKRSLDDYAQIIMSISRSIPAIVLEELRLSGETVVTAAAAKARENTQAAWK
jgi:ferritin-like metal-binding protein YciE